MKLMLYKIIHGRCWVLGKIAWVEVKMTNYLGPETDGKEASFASSQLCKVFDQDTGIQDLSQVLNYPVLTVQTNSVHAQQPPSFSRTTM